MLGECVDAVRYEGNACDRCTAGCETPPVSLVGMTAGMHCGAVTVVTPPQLSDVCLSVESLYELTLSLSLGDANYVLSIFSCSHRMQRNRLRRPAQHIIAPYLNSQ